VKAIIKSQPTVFVIFGATGDLTWRKLAPASYNLFLDNWLPEQFSIIGTARTTMTDEGFREKLLEGIDLFSRSGKADPSAWAQFSKRIFYQEAEFDVPHTYQELSARIAGHAGEWQQQPNVIYYLAVSPVVFPIIAQNLADHQLAADLNKTDVKPDSNTETFAAVKFFVDNWRWQGVPFYIRTSKRMHQSSSVITIQFKDVPHPIFSSDTMETHQQNRLVISIQPEMSIRLQVQAKRPGVDLVINMVDMVFDYHSTYTSEAPEAYETLLLDTMLGDQTLFMRGDQVEAAWALIMPILSGWKVKKSLHFPNYSADSWGPEGAEALLARDGFHWFTLPPTVKK